MQKVEERFILIEFRRWLLRFEDERSPLSTAVVNSWVGICKTQGILCIQITLERFRAIVLRVATIVDQLVGEVAIRGVRGMLRDETVVIRISGVLLKEACDAKTGF